MVERPPLPLPTGETLVLAIIAISGLVVSVMFGYFLMKLDSGTRENKKAQEHLDEAVGILKWLRSEEAAMTGITYDSDIRSRIDVLLKKVRKEYL